MGDFHQWEGSTQRTVLKPPCDWCRLPKMYAPLDRKLQKLLSKENTEKLTRDLFKNSQVSSGWMTVLRTLEPRLSDHRHLVLSTLEPRLSVPPGPSWYFQDPSLQFFRNQMAELPATSEKSKQRHPSEMVTVGHTFTSFVHSASL